jgi:integrase
MGHYFQKAAIRAGVPNATFHWLRHTLASRLYDMGVEERLACAIIGHSESVHKEYAHASKSKLLDKLSQVGNVEVLSSFTAKNDKIMTQQATFITDKKAASL